MPTSLRIRAAQVTLETASPLISALGITAPVDASGEDILGVPVWFAERPSGVATTLHAGKGVDSIDAQVGAMMEAIELAVAEWDAAHSVGEIWTLDNVLRQFIPPLSIAQLAPIIGAPATPDHLVLTDVCDDIRTGRPYRVPAELVRVPAPIPADGVWLFRWSSNGLASGSSLEEATLHALLEVLERDCIAMDLVNASTQRLDLRTLPLPLAIWAERWARLGIELRVRYLPNDFGLACFEACIAQHGSDVLSAAFGWGLHPDSGVAVARAITEAAQTRLHKRHGRAAPAHPAKVEVSACDLIGEVGQTIPLSDVPSLVSNSLAPTLQRMLSLLDAVGLPLVLRRQMSGQPGGPELGDICVVKVIVPGCESAVGSDVRMGHRLAKRLRQSM